MKTPQKLRLGFISVSFMVFPVTIDYLSPVISLTGAYNGIISGSIIIFASQFLISLILGRAFYGWVCPAGGLQDITLQFRTRKVNPERINWIKYLVWIPWLSGILMFIKNAEGINKVDFFFSTNHGFSVTDLNGLIAYVLVVLIFFLLALIIGRRSACHTICWMTPFMIIGRFIAKALRIPSLKLKLSDSPCISCGSCTKSCPMSINVMERVHKEKMENSDCILCGSCVDNCSSKTIVYSFGIIK